MLWKRRGVPPLLQDRIPRDPEDFRRQVLPKRAAPRCGTTAVAVIERFRDQLVGLHLDDVPRF
jgi:hypothetical protein